jgi:hypothetical protein
MKIYSIFSKGELDYDCYKGHIIVANSEEEVIELAKEEAAVEGKEAWDTEVFFEGEYLGEEKEPFILLSDFNAG